MLNLRCPKSYLNVVRFKYEDLCTVALMFEQHEFMFKFDLKSGYYHVDVHPDFHKFLSFQWEMKGTAKYFFCLTPLWVVHSLLFLLRPLIRYWRGRGLKAIIYLDDGIVAVPGIERALHESVLVKRNLDRAGLVVNVEKSVWEPSKSGLVY